VWSTRALIPGGGPVPTFASGRKGGGGGWLEGLSATPKSGFLREKKLQLGGKGGAKRGNKGGGKLGGANGGRANGGGKREGQQIVQKLLFEYGCCVSRLCCI